MSELCCTYEYYIHILWKLKSKNIRYQIYVFFPNKIKDPTKIKVCKKNEIVGKK